MSPINLLIGAIIEQMLGNKRKISFACLSLCLFLLSPLPLLKYLLAISACFPFSSWLKSQPWLMAQCTAGRLPPWHCPLEEQRALRWHRAVKIVS